MLRPYESDFLFAFFALFAVNKSDSESSGSMSFVNFVVNKIPQENC